MEPAKCITASPSRTSTKPSAVMPHEIVPRNPPVDHEYRLLKGEPAREIAAFAKSEAIDLIVLSTHGAYGLGRVLMGSVAEAVVRWRTALC